MMQTRFSETVCIQLALSLIRILYMRNSETEVRGYICSDVVDSSIYLESHKVLEYISFATLKKLMFIRIKEQSNLKLEI